MHMYSWDWGSVLMLYGSLDFTFWTYEEIKQISTSSMTPIESQEAWGIGPKGLTVITSYCANDIGCKVDLDYYVQFERAKNIVSAPSPLTAPSHNVIGRRMPKIGPKSSHLLWRVVQNTDI